MRTPAPPRFEPAATAPSTVEAGAVGRLDDRPGSLPPERCRGRAGIGGRNEERGGQAAPGQLGPDVIRDVAIAVIDREQERPRREGGASALALAGSRRCGRIRNWSAITSRRCGEALRSCAQQPRHDAARRGQRDGTVSTARTSRRRGTALASARDDALRGRGGRQGANDPRTAHGRLSPRAGRSAGGRWHARRPAAVLTTSAMNGPGSRREPTASIRGPRTERSQARERQLAATGVDDGRLEVVAPVDPLHAAVVLLDRLRQRLAERVAVGADRSSSTPPCSAIAERPVGRPMFGSMIRRRPVRASHLRLDVAQAAVRDAAEAADSAMSRTSSLRTSSPRRARAGVERPLAELAGDERDPRLAGPIVVARSPRTGRPRRRGPRTGR